MEDRDYEQEARKENWVPKEEWKGDPEKWVDAQTFVERGEKILPIVQSKLNKVEAELAEMRKANQEFGEEYKKLQKRQQAEKKKLLAELEDARAQAISDGDGKAAVEAEREIRQIESEKEEEPDKAEYQRIAQKWQSENEWYGSNAKLTALADGICDTIQREGYTGQAYFNELSRRVKEMEPDEFQNPERRRANSVESGGKTKTSKGKKADDLPPDAKAAGERFVKAGLFKSLEDYAKHYEWE